MKVAVFSTQSYDREFLTAANGDAGHDVTFYEPWLTAHTYALAAERRATVNDNNPVSIDRHDDVRRGQIQCLNNGDARHGNPGAP